MSKPIKEHHTSISKSSNADDSIKIAPDGRLIIVDEPSAPQQKSGNIIIRLHTYYLTCNKKVKELNRCLITKPVSTTIQYVSLINTVIYYYYWLHCFSSCFQTNFFLFLCAIFLSFNSFMNSIYSVSFLFCTNYILLF